MITLKDIIILASGENASYGTEHLATWVVTSADPTFKALGLTYPISLLSEGPEPNKDNWGFDAKIHYIFPKTPFSEGENLPVTWYDGAARPPQEVIDLLEGQKLPSQGSVIIGTKKSHAHSACWKAIIVSKKEFADHKIEVVEGGNHWHEFIDAIKLQITYPRPI